ncbi:MAG: LamG domain-containing protein, partial [Luteolibacter sp.]
MNYKRLSIISAFLLIGGSAQADILYWDSFDNDGLTTNAGIGGGAANRTIQGHSWTDDGNATFGTIGTSYTRRALLYSANTFQSDTGFTLTVKYTTGTIGKAAAHNFSFGLISTDTDISTYSGFNPFSADTGVYSIGANLTADAGEASRGLNFTDGSAVTTLDQSGTRAQFKAGESSEVTIEVGLDGYWCYRIDGEYEASGVFLDGFDFTKDYRIVVYGQDDHGGGKSIQSILLENGYAPGERAENIRSTWQGGQGSLDEIADFKTLDSSGIAFTDGAVLSAQHYAPHKLIESVALGLTVVGGDPIDAPVPTWGDISLDEPEDDTFLEEVLAVRAMGFQVGAYTNSENFVGSNSDYLQPFVDRWIDYCDTNAEVQDFIASQPFHTGVWNSTTGEYEVAYESDGVTETYPYRKYMFCYAEFVLKDYSLRYGKYIGSWVFDDGATMNQNGDNATSGLAEEQRIYQAYANAVRAGNPDIPVAYNNGRSTINYNSYPFAHATRFDDFSFGHAFGGNNNHASKTGSQFGSNYGHVTRMTETDGYIHEGGNWDWDDQIVGNFYSKLSTASWRYGTVQAWEQDDFNQWNLEAMQAGGRMIWDGSIPRSGPPLLGWAYTLLKNLDDYLAEFESPDTPNWARAYTVLPDAISGQAYYHVLVEGEDLWDPEGDKISSISAISSGYFSEVPSWLNISEDPNEPGQWILSGIPTEASATTLEFALEATEANGLSGSRTVELQVNESSSTLVDTGDGVPVWVSDPLPATQAFRYNEFSQTLIRGADFGDFDGDSLVITIESGERWLNLEEVAPDIWTLSGTPGSSDLGLDTVQLALSDGTQTVYTDLEITVTDTRFLTMERNSISGGANWTAVTSETEEGDLTYSNSGTNYSYRALTYSAETFQSDGGFTLTVNYTTGTVDASLAHNFSFGLISADSDLSTYDGYNAFLVETGVYSLGVNLTAVSGESTRGLNFTNGSTVTTLDQSGTNVEFVAGASTEVTLEVGINGAWSYSINGVEEASGVITEGFDLTKSYYVAFYGQDDNGNGKSVQSMALDLNEVPELGLVAEWSMDDGSGADVTDSSGQSFDATATNGTWVSGLEGGALDFNGSNSSVTLPAEAFAYVNDEVSFAFWQYGDNSQPNADTLLSAINSADERVLNLHLPWTNGTVYWDAGNDGSSYDRISKAASASEYKDQWNHWVFTKNANTGAMAIYLNGALWHSGTGMGKDMSGIATAILGNNIAGNAYDGILDEVQLYDVELSASEVFDLAYSYTTNNGTPKAWLVSNGIAPTNAGAVADTDGDGLVNWREYNNGTDPQVADNPAGIRVTEYYLTSGDFTGTSKALTLDQNLADDYFILVRGSRDGDGESMPDNDYVRVTGVPYGGSRYAGSMVGSGNNNLITLERSVSDFDWEGVVTVVECTNPSSPAGFDLIDIVSTEMVDDIGTDTCVAWSDINQVALFGGYRGGGVNYVGTPTRTYDNASAHIR